MLSLRDTQIAFLAAIRSEDAGILAGLVVADGIPPDRRLQIYRNNHRLGALEAMRAAYPVIERLGGSDWFAQSTMNFQASHPSRSGDLQHLGADYPAYLAGQLRGTEHAYFGGVAALEWAYQLVLTAEERGPVDVAVLHAVAPQDYENLLFVPRPAVALVESAFPIFAIWQSNQPSAATDADIRLDAGGSRVLLIRRPDHVELRDMAAGSFELLRQFQRGAPLGAAAAVAASVSGSFDLSRSLRELLGLEAIAAITPRMERKISQIGGRSS